MLASTRVCLVFVARSEKVRREVDEEVIFSHEKLLL